MNGKLPLAGALVLAAALFGGAVHAESVSPTKSPTDDKAYRGLMLENGLKVMLVSSPDTDQAAASLDVHVGSGSDPDGWNGLAHFLEHMLFLGTEKYPEAGEYQSFIQSRGGSHNAFTAYDHTNYFFGVNHDSLEPALDRFSRFFIDPTFDAQYVERERLVVHSEYQARLKDEGRRIWAAQKQLLNPGHPASRFSVGSKDTLRDREGETVRERLIQFYERWYSADIMALTVVGRESLDELETLVRDRFAEVPKRGVSPPLYVQSYLNRDLGPARINIVPNQDLNQLSFIFEVPSTVEEYRSKPLSYIANLLGHEGEGSLLAALKAKGWASSLSAGAGFMDRRQGTLQISIGLTEPGLDRVEEIGSLLFHTIGLLNREGIEEWRFLEDKKLGDIAFRFAEEPRASSLATSISSRLHDYPMTEVLSAPYLIDVFDPDRLGSLLTYLTPGRSYLQFVSQRNRSRNVSPYYGVLYDIEPLDPAMVETWREALEGEEVPVADAVIALPEPNRFLPERLELLADVAPMDKPIQIEEAGIETWYQLDQEFQSPRAGFFVSIKSPAANATARQSVLTELLVRVLNDQLNVETYPARLAGLSYSLYRHSRGISMRVGGYQDRQAELLKVILDALRDPVLDATRLELKKDDLIRELRNRRLDRPSSQTVHEIYRLLMTPYWTERERIDEIESVSIEELSAHARAVFASVSLLTLAHGDVSRDEALEMSALVGAAFEGAETVDTVQRPRLRRLGYTERFLRTMDIDHTDTVLTYYFQGDEKSVAGRARSGLLAQLVEAPFYFDLRTTNRVGYLVFASSLDILEVPGLMFSVQSPSHNATQLQTLFDEFINALPEQIEAMSDADYSQTRAGLIARLLQRETNLSSRTDRYWQEIDLGETGFDTRQQLAAEIGGLEKADMLEYVRQLMEWKRRLLVVQSAGTRPDAVDEAIAADGWLETGAPETFRETADGFFPAN